MSPDGAQDEIIQTIREAIDTLQAIRFWYNDSERIVEPYVFGVSSEGNPLMRGFQTDGVSLSGKGPGWRVFQVLKMFDVILIGEYFTPNFSEYDPYTPWIYEVDSQIV